VHVIDAHASCTWEIKNKYLDRKHDLLIHRKTD